MTAPRILPTLPLGAGGSTSAPDGDADLGPGKGQADDAAKDAAALASTNVRELAPAGASESDAQAAADLDAAIAEARAVVAERVSCSFCVGAGMMPSLWPSAPPEPCFACGKKRPGPLASADEEP